MRPNVPEDTLETGFAKMTEFNILKPSALKFNRTFSWMGMYLPMPTSTCCAGGPCSELRRALPTVPAGWGGARIACAVPVLLLLLVAFVPFEYTSGLKYWICPKVGLFPALENGLPALFGRSAPLPGLV